VGLQFLSESEIEMGLVTMLPVVHGIMGKRADRGLSTEKDTTLPLKKSSSRNNVRSATPSTPKSPKRLSNSNDPLSVQRSSGSTDTRPGSSRSSSSDRPNSEISSRKTHRSSNSSGNSSLRGSSSVTVKYSPSTTPNLRAINHNNDEHPSPPSLLLANPQSLTVELPENYDKRFSGPKKNNHNNHLNLKKSHLRKRSSSVPDLVSSYRGNNPTNNRKGPISELLLLPSTNDDREYSISSTDMYVI